MSKRSISTIKIAATFIGTVVGAGFASGQEILQFFVVFGNRGLWGLILVTLLFIVFGYIIMSLGRDLLSKSHLEIIQFSSGKHLSKIIDYIITFFLFGALTTMIAGAGAILNQQLNISSIWGSLILAAVTAITVLAGINGIINSISAIVPFLLVSAVSASIAAFFIPPFESGNVTAHTAASGMMGNWIWSAILYTSYNIVLSIAVLGALGVKAKNKESILSGAILGGLGLGLGAAAIFFALTKTNSISIAVEVPMTFIANRISNTFQIFYSIILFAEIYSTAVSNLYSFTARMIDMQKSTAKLYVIGTTILALIASQFGFSRLVKYFYPIMGYCGIILLISLLYSRLRFNPEKFSTKRLHNKL